jgi:hypothetical protein
MLKHVAVALDMDLDVPLNFWEQTYVLPKHLHLLDPDSLTDESDMFLYGTSDNDPEPDFDSESESTSDYPLAKDLYSELLLLGVHFLGDIQELTQRHFGDIHNCPEYP